MNNPPGNTSKKATRKQQKQSESDNDETLPANMDAGKRQTRRQKSKKRKREEMATADFEEPKPVVLADVKKPKWAEAPKSGSAISLEEIQPIPRNHDAFQIFRSLEALQAGTNKPVRLPALDALSLPKGLEGQVLPNGLLRPILLTQQRIEILEKYIDQILSSNPTYAARGMILSGPNGQGKSVMCYLLACAAYANNCILTYIPHCSEFARNSTSIASKYFLDRLMFYNPDLLPYVPHGQNSNLASYISENMESDPYETYSEAIRVLSRTRHPVVYLLGEHNEIWKKNLQNEDMFRMWTIGTSVPHGLRTFIVYSGSAHTPFEYHLQYNMLKWVVHLQPLAELTVEKSPVWGKEYDTKQNSSFVPFITMGAFPVTPPLKTLLDDSKTAHETYQLIFDVTHGNPREIRSLLEYLLENWTDSSCLAVVAEEWVNLRKGDLERELRSFVVKNQLLLTSFHNFLASFFGEVELKHSPGNFTDTGLLYRPDPRRAPDFWKSTSRPAYRSLLQYYFENVVPTYTMDEGVTNPAVVGVRFETLIVLKIQRGWSVCAVPFDSHLPKVTLQFPGFQSKPLELLEKGSLPNKSGSPALYLPPTTHFNFPYWAIVFHEPRSAGRTRDRLTFMQTTISTPQDHEKDDGIVKSLQKLVPRIVLDITGKKITCYYDKNGTGHIVWEPKTAVDLRFVVLTWQPSNKVKKQVVGHYEHLPDNLLIVPKEDIDLPVSKPSTSR